MTHDVRDFDTPQDALDAVTGEGGTVLFPAGVYEITEGLRPKSGTKIVGDGVGSVIKCPDAGFPLVPVIGFGLINIDNKDDVTIDSIRLFGSKQQDINSSPKLIFLENTNNIEVCSCRLEHTAYEGFWQGGQIAATRGVWFHHNYIEDVGTAAGQFVALPAVQLNVADCIVTDNILRNVGIGIGVSGEGAIVSNNIIDGTLKEAIGVGDGGTNKLTVISNNTISILGDSVLPRRGIFFGPNASNNPQVCYGNQIFIEGAPGDGVPQGIYSGGLSHFNATNNTINIKGFGNGIVALGATPEAKAVFHDNTINIDNDTTEFSIGLIAVPSGAGVSLFVVSSNNTVYTNNPIDFAIDYNQISGGAITAVVSDDVVDNGQIRVGDLHYANNELARKAINLRYPQL